MSKSFLRGLRESFREGVYARDDHKCRVCGMKEGTNGAHLDAHHITDRHQLPNDGYTLSNGITLCPEHHKKAEVWHSTHQHCWVPGFTPDELYSMIGSSAAKAYADSWALDPRSAYAAHFTAPPLTLPIPPPPPN